jgi:hypothetical protein
MQFSSVSVVPRYLNVATSSKDLFDIFMLYFCPNFWLRDINMYLVFSGFTSRPASLLASNKAFVVFHTTEVNNVPHRNKEKQMVVTDSLTTSWTIPSPTRNNLDGKGTGFFQGKGNRILLSTYTYNRQAKVGQHSNLQYGRDSSFKRSEPPESCCSAWYGRHRGTNTTGSCRTAQAQYWLHSRPFPKRPRLS